MSTRALDGNTPKRTRPVGNHPLEVIPYFRRFEPGVVRDLVFTFIWNCALAAGFMLIAFAGGARGITAEYFGAVLLVSNLIGYSVHLLFLLGFLSGLEQRVRGSGTLAMAAYYTGMALLGVTGGMLLISFFLDQRVLQWFASPRSFVSVAVSTLIVSTVLTGVFVAREKRARAEAELERARAHAEHVEREAVAAHLRALQAQIEPHFLFNTLANVVSLIDREPAVARRMLERFIRFLRASLAATREERTTLGAEADLISAYLDVLQVRMGERLKIAIDLEDGLSTFALPPMLLQPVVENAIRHGLEPKVEGGEVAFRARRDGAHVVVEIVDTGVGFAPTTKGGVGLTNLRDRLRMLYGEAGSLEVRENPAGGAIVSLRIPA